LWWPSLTKDMQTEQLLCWSGLTYTEHSTTSSSNEEEELACLCGAESGALKNKITSERISYIPSYRFIGKYIPKY